MNLFIMNAEDILHHYKPQTEAESYLIEKLRDTFDDLYKMQSVLSDYSLSYYDERMLDSDLKNLTNEMENLKDENERLQSELKTSAFE